MSADSRSPVEFRESSRAPVQAPATIQLDAFSEPLSGYTANVSMGGMFVQMDRPPPVGSIVRFKLELEEPASQILGTAEVAWMRTKAKGAELPAGVGMQFRFIEADGEGQLRLAVERALAQLGPEPEPRAPVKSRRPPKPPPRRTIPEPRIERRRERPTRLGKAAKKGQPVKAKKKTEDERSTILGLPAERAKIVLLVILMAILLFALLP